MSKYARLHGITRARRNRREIASAGNLAEPVPALRPHAAIPGVFLGLPKDRNARLRHAYDPVHAQEGVPRTKSPETVLAGITEPGHLLRNRSEPDSARRRGGGTPGVVPRT